MNTQINTNELISADDLKYLNDLFNVIKEANTASALLYMTDNPILNIVAKNWATEISKLRQEIEGLTEKCNQLD